MGCSIVLEFGSDGLASLSVSGVSKGKNNAVICGERGTIEIVEPFWCPNVLIVNGQRQQFSPVTGSQDSSAGYNFVNSEGFKYEAEAVSQSILNGT